MKRLKSTGLKAVSIILTISILLPMLPFVSVFAAEPEQQVPPQKLQVLENGVGYDPYDKYYADLKWEYPSGFFIPESVGTYLNFYAQEVPKSYRTGGARIAKERNVRIDSGITSRRMKDLKTGTIYYFDTTAYYKYTEVDKTMTGTESEPSNRVKVMTNIDINAYSVGNNKIKIEWDDVWNTTGRINYKLYISDSSDFANASPKFIEPTDIGAGKPVQVNQSTGKLEYIHTTDEPGRVYYIKVVPEIMDNELKDYPKESKVMQVSSFILVRTTKMSSSSDGSIWKLEWSPVVVGLGDSDVKIQYEVFKGDIRSSDFPNRIQTVNNTSILVVMAPGEEANSYFVINANVTRNGTPVYPGIKIQSDKVMVKDQEVPASPPQPELVPSIGSVNAEIKADNAAILWKLPKKANGDIDYDTIYDVWLVSSPDELSKPDGLGTPVSWSLTSGRTTGSNGAIHFEFDFVKNGTNIVGCKAILTGLTSNATYYYRIVARKSYLQYVDDILTYVPYSSEPAIKNIVTPPDGNINTPVTVPRPPFKLEKKTDTKAVVQIKNRWYEEYNPTTNKWEYIVTEKTSHSQADPNYPINPIDPVNQNNYRLVQYDDKVKMDVYYIKYSADIVYTELNDPVKYPAQKVAGFSTIANDPEEDETLNFPDKLKKRNVNMEIPGLEPNTTYVMWVKAVRSTANPSESVLSDPIIVTTDPSPAFPVEKPTVPVLLANQIGDTFVDLIWEFKEGYKYYIKYGTVENLSSASSTLTVDLQGKNYYRIEGLTRGTLYYFWIQAEYVSPTGVSARSEWSDAYSVKTMPDIPPSTPAGFGVKSGEGTVTKNSITFEWIREQGLEYILEIATSIEYKDVKEYKVGAVSELKVDNLRSNCRYFARLYAYDPIKKLTSEPTQSVTVRTQRSSDDYDSDADTDNMEKGDYVVKDKVVIRGTWTIRITGINADRFIEHMQKDNVLDYRLDVSSPPARVTKVSILVSNKVFDALNRLKENLIIAADSCEFTIRPYVLSADLAKDSGVKLADFNYEVLITYKGQQPDSSNGNILFKTNSTGFQVNAYEGSNAIPIVNLNKPVKVRIPYTDGSFYKEELTAGYVFDISSKTWKKSPSVGSFDADKGKGYLDFEMDMCGDIAVAEPGSEFFNDILGHEYEQSIIAVASLHTLKSISGKAFNPDRGAKMGDTVKIMLDVLDYRYGNDFMTVAVKTKLILQSDLNHISGSCTREKLLAMSVRVYEIKTGVPVKASSADSGIYRDYNSVNTALRTKVAFAVENGIAVTSGSDFIGPGETVTRGEVMATLERVLSMAGELE
jgi:hypothetical protein